MIQQTVERIRPLVQMEDVYISTNTAYKDLVLAQLPDISAENILCEPVGRNTAPCIGLGAVHAAEKYNDALMMVLPSDHLIKYHKMFLSTLKDGCRIAEKDRYLVTIGITPDYPETGYGYIQFRAEETDGHAYKVERFVEKSDLETEEYLWNSGMYIWKVSTILDNIKQFLPNLYNGLHKIREAIGTREQEMVLENLKICSRDGIYGRVLMKIFNHQINTIAVCFVRSRTAIFRFRIAKIIGCESKNALYK